jgi:hypothetical protein
MAVRKTLVAASSVAMCGLFVAYRYERLEELEQLAQSATAQAYTPGALEKKYLAFVLGGGTVNQIKVRMRELLLTQYCFDVEGRPIRASHEDADLPWVRYMLLLKECSRLIKDPQPTPIIPFINACIALFRKEGVAATANEGIEQQLLKKLSSTLDEHLVRAVAEAAAHADAELTPVSLFAQCLHLNIANAPRLTADSIDPANGIKNSLFVAIRNGMLAKP